MNGQREATTGKQLETNEHLEDGNAQDRVLADAQDATHREHELSFWAGIRQYPKAVAWSMIMSTALVMDGYDFKLIGSLFAQPAFAKAYGKQQPNGSYQIPALWQTGLNNGSNVGQMIGLLVAGSVVDRIGFRKTMMGALCVVPCLIFIQFFANSLALLEVGQILLGIPLGIFQTITCVYTVEILPVCLRAYLTSYASGCWLIGQLISAGVLRGTLHLNAPWAYRIPFSTQWFWPIPVLVAAVFAPESPWYLVRRNRLDEAKHSLRRLASPSDDEKIDVEVEKTIALMILTISHEREATTQVSFLFCFKGTDLRRTIIVIGCYCITVSSGSTVRAYATYFFQQAGLSTDQASSMSIGLYALGVLVLIGTVIHHDVKPRSLPADSGQWLLMPHFGRRTIFLYGQSVQTLVLFAVGGLGIAQRSSTSDQGLSWGIGVLLLLSSFIENLAISPVLYALVSELPSSLLRNKSVVIARFSYAVVNVIANVITPYQLNPSAWNWRAASGLFWGGFCAMGLGFTYFCVPEPKGRTIGELDLLFEKRTSARRFASTDVEVREMVNEAVRKLE